MADKDKFKVEASMSMPVPKRGRKKVPISDVYPFSEMKIGDMFIVAGKQNIQKARNASQQFVKENGPAWKFQTRDISGMKVPNIVQQQYYEPETYGVWRVVPTQSVAVQTEPQAEIGGPIPVITVNPTETPDEDEVEITITQDAPTE